VAALLPIIAVVFVAYLVIGLAMPVPRPDAVPETGQPAIFKFRRHFAAFRA
jgi:hypothetical protein